MNPLKNSTLYAFLILLAVTGCSSVRTTSDYDPNANFSGLKTYAWAKTEPPKEGEADPRVDNTIVDNRIRTAVDRELSDRGYGKTDPAEADFLVGYHAGVKRQTEVTTFDSPSYYGSRWYGTSWYTGYGGTDTYVNSYDEGTLILDVIDPKTGKLLWQGTGKRAIDWDWTPQERQKNTFEAVGKVLDRFPPKMA